MIETQKNSRRQFIKTFVTATTYSCIAGKVTSGNLIAEIQAAATIDSNLKIKISDFPVLSNEGGSVRLGLSGITTSSSNPLPRNSQFYPIMINRDAGDVFHVLNTRCTHQGTVVGTYNTNTSSCRCPNHGSLYRIDGSRISGQATGPLAKLTSEFDGDDTLSILIPNLNYEIVGTNVNASGNGRFQIDFSPLNNLTYEVVFRPDVSAAWEAVPFSTSPDGETNLMEITGTGRPILVYVDQTMERGFYAVGAKLNEV